MSSNPFNDLSRSLTKLSAACEATLSAVWADNSMAAADVDNEPFYIWVL